MRGRRSGVVVHHVFTDEGEKLPLLAGGCAGQRRRLALSRQNSLQRAKRRADVLDGELHRG